MNLWWSNSISTLKELLQGKKITIFQKAKSANKNIKFFFIKDFFIFKLSCLFASQ